MRRKGVGGGGTLDMTDVPAASNIQHRDFTSDVITYRTHSIHNEDIEKLSEQTAAACTVQEISRITMNSQQHTSDEADQDNISLRSDQITLEMKCKMWNENFINFELWNPGNYILTKPRN